MNPDWTECLPPRHRASRGIAIGDAHQMVLPLGPMLIASLGPVHAFGTIPSGRVDALNVAQVRAAQQRVYFRPGSGLEPVVRAALRRHPRRLADAS
jgi:hypothetical protein